MASEKILSKWIINGIAVVVTSVWAASFIADIFVKGYNPNPSIHLIMMAIVGAVFGHHLMRKNGNGNGNSKPPINRCDYCGSVYHLTENCPERPHYDSYKRI